MQSELKIFVEQLKDGHKEKIQLTLPADFLQMQEKELEVIRPVEISGEAYTTDDSLILHLNCRTAVRMPCAVCNDPAEIELSASDIYFSQPFEELKSEIFDYAFVVREELLLLLPQFAECKGKCSKRKDLEALLKKKPAAANVQYPFADL